MDLRVILEAELSRRRQRNPRYSMRAFAQSLQTHHSTISAILQSRRRLTPRSIRMLGTRLGLSDAEIRDACVTEHCAAIRRLVRDRRFRPDSRWIAIMGGIPLDEVNIALNWLLYHRQLTMAAADQWILEEDASCRIP